MIQIFLDGLEAAIPEKASIKFTSENQFFTKSTSYTYEIELPLSLEPNRRIFGYINRLDVPKASRSMSARMMVDNVTVLVGTAHITSVTNTSVKVQLLGSAASYNYGNKMEAVYIDELDLGDWVNTTYPGAYPAGYKFTGSTSSLYNASQPNTGSRPDIGGSEPDIPEKASFPIGFQPWVAYPVLNSTAGLICNTYIYQEKTKNGRDFEMQFRPYSGVRRGDRPNDDLPVDNFAVQPYVWIMAEKIAEATGFTLRKTDNTLYTNTLFRRIFIVNANNYVECNKCLPHWSVNEWWTEIENTFGLVMTVDYSDMSMRLSSRSQFYHNLSRKSMTVIDRILDEYSVEIDDDTQADISVSNVGFADHEGGREDILSDYVLENADVEEASGIDSLLDKVKSYPANRKNRYAKTLFKCSDGRQFIYASDCGADAGDRTDHSDDTYQEPDFGTAGGRQEQTRPAGKGEGLAEVNMFRPRIADTDNKDIDVELRFVPARFVTADAKVYKYVDRNSGAGYADRDVPAATFPVTVLEKPDIGDLSWYRSKNGIDFDIEAVINEEADEESTSVTASDVIYIAIDNPEPDNVAANFKLDDKEEISRTFPHPRALLRERTFGLIDKGKTVYDPGISLSLIPIAGQRNLASETVTGGIEIDTLSRHCIKFISSRIPDVGAIFNISNRLFVCEKIEADITVAGLNRLLTGYFYEVTL